MLERVFRSRERNSLIGAAMLKQRGQMPDRIEILDGVLQLGRKPRREAHQCGVSLGLPEREPKRHHAALAEAQHYEPARVNRISCDGGIDELLSAIDCLIDLVLARGRAGPYRKPA